MKLLLATNHLGLGGSESYLLTVAEQLDRLGHETVVYVPEGGAGVAAAAERGISVLGEAELDDDGYDAALSQDAGVVYQIADRLPGLPQLFVAHSVMFDLQTPPQLDGMVGTVVALNDRVARRMRSYANEVEVVRLRQPIDTSRFDPRGALPETPRSVLLLSNTPNMDRRAQLEAACAEAGLELSTLGGRSGQKADIRPALAGAEIVIGYGRSILEAMAMGRAAFVYDWKGGDGWVTADSYPAIEADGLAGGAGVDTVDTADLADELRGYSASMGPLNRDLIVRHHRASVHAQELIALFERLAEPSPRQRAPLQEMARLVRLEWRARSDMHALVEENAHLRGLLMDSDRSAREAREQVVVEKQRGDESEARVESMRRSYESSVSWRVTRPLRALTRALARRRNQV